MGNPPIFRNCLGVSECIREPLPPATINEKEYLPEKFVLFQNYPNPFNSQTIVRFQIPEPGNVTISIIDILGRKILLSQRENVTSGNHEFIWNGMSQNGMPVNSGTYFIRFQFIDNSNNVFTDIKKMIYLK